MRRKAPTADEVTDDLLELIAESRPPDLQPNDITLKRMCDLGVSPRVAKRLLDEWIAAGKVKPLGKRRAGNGSLVDAWARVKSR